jgi:hypothetical protein
MRSATYCSTAGLPFTFHGADAPEGQALLGHVGNADGPFTVLIRYDGQVLANPTKELTASMSDYLVKARSRTARHPFADRAGQELRAFGGDGPQAGTRRRSRT